MGQVLYASDPQAATTHDEEYRVALQRIDELGRVLRSRFDEVSDLMRPYLVSELSVATPDELTERHELFLTLQRLEPVVYGDPKERIRMGRELRRLRVPMPDRPTFAELTKLYTSRLGVPA